MQRTYYRNNSQPIDQKSVSGTTNSGHGVRNTPTPPEPATPLSTFQSNMSSVLISDASHHRLLFVTPSPSETVLVKQPVTRPITEQQLINEVKGIYAGLVMVEKKCVEIVAQQASSTTQRLKDQQWKALVALHRTPLHEHHGFFSASQNFAASDIPQKLAFKYAMPARMWRHGIHAFLELLRHHLPDSMEHMLSFIYLAYSMMVLLKESVPTFVETWIECLGDLARYRMAIKDADLRDLEIWSNIAKMWYNKTADESPDIVPPNIGRIQYHLAVLSRPDFIEHLFNYDEALASVVPLINARESIMLSLDMLWNGQEGLITDHPIKDELGVELKLGQSGMAENFLVRYSPPRHDYDGTRRGDTVAEIGETDVEPISNTQQTSLQTGERAVGIVGDVPLTDVEPLLSMPKSFEEQPNYCLGIIRAGAFAQAISISSRAMSCLSNFTLNLYTLSSFICVVHAHKSEHISATAVAKNDAQTDNEMLPLLAFWAICVPFAIAVPFIRPKIKSEKPAATISIAAFMTALAVGACKTQKLALFPGAMFAGLSLGCSTDLILLTRAKRNSTWVAFLRYTVPAIGIWHLLASSELSENGRPLDLVLSTPYLAVFGAVATNALINEQYDDLKAALMHARGKILACLGLQDIQQHDSIV